MERHIPFTLEEAKAVRVWANAYVKQHGIDVDCTAIEAIILKMVKAFEPPQAEEKPRLKVAAGSQKGD